LILEQKILQFSAALFIIEKFADYSEEAGFTQVSVVRRPNHMPLSHFCVGVGFSLYFRIW